MFRAMSTPVMVTADVDELLLVASVALHYTWRVFPPMPSGFPSLLLTTPIAPSIPTRPVPEICS